MVKDSLASRGKDDAVVPLMRPGMRGWDLPRFDGRSGPSKEVKLVVPNWSSRKVSWRMAFPFGLDG